MLNTEEQTGRTHLHTEPSPQDTGHVINRVEACHRQGRIRKEVRFGSQPHY